MVDTTSKMCITAMFIIVYLHAFHIKCAGMFINHLHTTFHMPWSNCSLVTTITLKRNISSAIMFLTYNLQTYYYTSHQVHKKCSSNIDPTSHVLGLPFSIANCQKLKNMGYWNVPNWHNVYKFCEKWSTQIKAGMDQCVYMHQITPTILHNLVSPLHFLVKKKKSKKI